MTQPEQEARTKIDELLRAAGNAKAAIMRNRGLSLIYAINLGSKKRRSFVAPLFAAGYSER